MSRSRRTTQNPVTGPARSRVRVIGGKWRGRWIDFPEAEGLRPTGDRMRETLFNWLQADVPGAQCLDLYAGSGALGIEAVSRGALGATLIDSNSAVAANLREQTNRLGGERFDIHCTDPLRYLNDFAAADNSAAFDIAFVDPPFALDVQLSVLALMAELEILAKNASVYVEAPAAADIVSGLPAGFALHRSPIQAQVQCLLLHWQ